MRSGEGRVLSGSVQRRCSPGKGEGGPGGGMEAGGGQGPLSLAAREAWHTHGSDSTYQACLPKASSALISPEARVRVGLLEKFRE